MPYPKQIIHYCAVGATLVVALRCSGQTKYFINLAMFITESECKSKGAERHV